MGPLASSEAARRPRSRLAGNRARTPGALAYTRGRRLGATPAARAPSLPLPKSRFQPMAARDDLDRSSSPARRCLAGHRRATQQSPSLQAPLAGHSPGRLPRAPAGSDGAKGEGGIPAAGVRSCFGRLRPNAKRRSRATWARTARPKSPVRRTGYLPPPLQPSARLARSPPTVAYTTAPPVPSPPVGSAVRQKPPCARGGRWARCPSCSACRRPRRR